MDEQNSDNREREYLKERAKIDQEVAEGKIVVSYDEISPDRWEHLTETLKAAGFERSDGDLIDGASIELAGAQAPDGMRIAARESATLAASERPSSAVFASERRESKLHRYFNRLREEEASTGSPEHNQERARLKTRIIGRFSQLPRLRQVGLIILSLLWLVVTVDLFLNLGGDSPGGLYAALPRRGPELVVRFAPAATSVDITMFLERYGARLVSGPTEGLYVIRLPGTWRSFFRLEGTEISNLAARMRTETSVVVFVDTRR